jgi:hypothetical protein
VQLLHCEEGRAVNNDAHVCRHKAQSKAVIAEVAGKLLFQNEPMCSCYTVNKGEPSTTMPMSAGTQSSVQQSNAEMVVFTQHTVQIAVIEAANAAIRLICLADGTLSAALLHAYCAGSRSSSFTCQTLPHQRQQLLLLPLQFATSESPLI